MTAPIPADGAPANAGPNRVLLIAGAGVAVLLVVFLATRLLSGGGSDEDTTSTTLPLVIRTTTTTAPATPGAAAPVESFEVFTTKDPFRPLRTVGSGGGGTTGGGTTGGGTTGGGTTGGGTTGGGTTGTTARSGTTGTTARGGGTTSTTRAPGTNNPQRSQRVSVVDVFVDAGRSVVSIRVNDTVYKVGAGDVFASNFKVLSIDQSAGCGRFLFGDDQFRLCEGEEALK